MYRIQELRINSGLTQKQLAEKIGVKNYIIGNWEQGRTEPSVKDLIDLSNIFECSIDYLLGRENDFGQIVLTANLSYDVSEVIGLYSNLTDNKKKIVTALLKELNG